MPDGRDPRPMLAGLAALVVGACLLAVVVTSPLVALGTVAVVAVTATVFAVRAWRHARVSRAFIAASIPGAVDDVAVRWLPFDATAAVAGLRRPKVFCHPTLRSALDAEELRAVVLHERHHQIRRDPLRLIALDTISPIVQRVPGGQQWIEDRRAMIEIEADAYALARGTSRRDLIRALMKVGHVPAAEGAAGFAPAVDQRLRALVEVDVEERGPGSARRGALSLSIGMIGVAAVCVAGVAHHLALAGTTIGCVWSGC